MKLRVTAVISNAEEQLRAVHTVRNSSPFAFYLFIYYSAPEGHLGAECFLKPYILPVTDTMKW